MQKERLKLLRKEKGLSQTELAAAIALPDGLRVAIKRFISFPRFFQEIF